MTPADKCGQFHPPTELQSACQSRSVDGAQNPAPAASLAGEGHRAACRTKPTRQCDVDRTRVICREYGRRCGAAWWARNRGSVAELTNTGRPRAAQLARRVQVSVTGRRHIAQPRVRRWELTGGQVCPVRIYKIAQSL